MHTGIFPSGHLWNIENKKTNRKERFRSLSVGFACFVSNNPKIFSFWNIQRISNKFLYVNWYFTQKSSSYFMQYIVAKQRQRDRSIRKLQNGLLLYRHRRSTSARNFLSDWILCVRNWPSQNKAYVVTGAGTFCADSLSVIWMALNGMPCSFATSCTFGTQ